MLRILAGPSQNRSLDTVSGFAIPPALASVYYDYTPRLPAWDKNESDAAVVLGCVIAHEIGHLLLDSRRNSHSVAGIMQARWSFEQLRLILMGKLLFLPEESTAMRAEMRARAEPGPDNITFARSVP